VRGELPHACQHFLREDIHFDFQRRVEGGGDARFQDDDVAYLDRMEELQAIDRGGDDACARVAIRRHGAGDVDEMHDRAAQHEPEGVRIVRQHDLRHVGRRFSRRFRCEIHAGFHFTRGRYGSAWITDRFCRAGA